MSLLQSAPVPTQEALVDAERKITPRWVDWLVALTTRIDQSPRVLVTKRLADQDATIATTPFALGSIAPALYRIHWYARISRAAGTSSELTITIGWTDGGIACSQAGALMNGNTTATTQSGTVILRADQGTPITYAALRASVGAPTMRFNLDVSCEVLN